jgi:DNA polymerase III alpha subunit
MKIKSLTSLGVKRTYSPEMQSKHHNYLTGNSSVIHKNSHGVAYAAIIAYRCTWFKAHFFPEWIASVLSTCDPKKAPRYISVARAEGWHPTEITKLGRPPKEGYEKFEIIPVDVNNLSPNFSVIGNVVSVGMLSIKGIGESDRAITEVEGPFESLDDFIERTNAGKTLVERLIRLGAFEKVPEHENRRALWHYYAYKYKKMKTAERRELYPTLIEHVGWSPSEIENERDRQVDAYRDLFPRKKEANYPKRVTEWMPEDKHDLKTFNELFDDYKISEIIDYEEEYLGYHLSNPLLMYDTRANRDIQGCIEDFMTQQAAFLECIINEVHRGSTQKGDPYCRLNVTDGRETTTVFIWSDNLEKINPSVLRKGVACMIPVTYQPKRKSFTMLRNNVIIPLNRKD